MIRQIRRIWRRLGFRILGALLAVMYLCVAVGVPLPVKGISKDLSEPFPCMNSSCGCRSAEQCWKSCCCHTLAERIEWARQNGVRPPAFAVAHAKTAGIDVTWLVESRPEKPKGVRSCCAAALKASPHSCCEKRLAILAGETPHVCCTDATGKSGQKRASDRIIGWRALDCQGHSLNWLAAALTLIVLQPVLTHEPPLVGWLGPTVSENAHGIAGDPAVPPPKQA
jgi:hypothetical protein